MSEETGAQKVAKFETFINDVLKKSLAQNFRLLDTIEEELANLEQAGANILSMAKLAGDEPLKTRVNVGCDFFMQANADVKMFLVCVGLDCYVEFNRDEALEFVRFRASQLQKRAAEVRDKGAQIRAQITLALHCIQEVERL